MEKEKILKAADRLPEILAGKYPIEDHEIFEGNEYGAHFKLTRNFMPLEEKRLSFWTLSVSGNSEGKKRIIDDFIQAFGTPNIRNENPSLTGIEFISWPISS